MTYRTFAIGSALVLVLLALTAYMLQPHQYTGSVVDPPLPPHNVTLTDYNGQPSTLAVEPGKVTLVYFGYTHCPDFCPTTMSDWRIVKRELGSAADNVRFVMVTIDPERDTEPVLKDYMTKYDPSFVGLRPTKDQLETLSRVYGVGVDSNALGGHAHDPSMHGTYTYAFDGSGQLRVLFPFGTQPDKIADDVRALIRSNS